MLYSRIHAVVIIIIVEHTFAATAVVVVVGAVSAVLRAAAYKNDIEKVESERANERPAPVQ